MQSSYYWSGTEFDFGSAWVFGFSNNLQDGGGQNNGLYSWAVHAGNVSAVPVPAAVWLFGSGLIGLLGLAPRKR